MSDGKGKFKVGDRVRRIVESEWPGHFGVKGKEYTVLELNDSGNPVVIDGENAADQNAFELVQASPIRTVTRREIVPGVYGEVTVGATFGEEAAVEVMLSRNPDCRYSADELREAAHLFNQLAEVLEENGKAAA